MKNEKYSVIILILGLLIYGNNLKSIQSSNSEKEKGVWFLEDIDSLKSIISTEENDTLRLIAETRYNYLECSEEKLITSLLDKWEKEIQPATKEEIDSMSILKKNAYDIYSLFLSKTYNLDKEKNRYNDMVRSIRKYDDLSKKKIIINTDLRCFIDTSKGINYNKLYKTHILEKSKGYDLKIIRNFRPSIKSIRNKILYLDKKYRKVFSGFVELNLEDNNFLEKIFYSDSELYFKKRYKRFLTFKKYFSINGGAYHAIYYNTAPFITSMTINSDYTAATLHYSSVWEGSSMLFKKNDKGKWYFSNFSNHGWVQ